jgi:hypothetical protein
MLTQMLRPRIHQEYFQITIRDFSIAEDRPSDTIATSHPLYSCIASTSSAVGFGMTA